MSGSAAMFPLAAGGAAASPSAMNATVAGQHAKYLRGHAAYDSAATGPSERAKGRARGPPDEKNTDTACESPGCGRGGNLPPSRLSPPYPAPSPTKGKRQKSKQPAAEAASSSSPAAGSTSSKGSTTFTPTPQTPAPRPYR